MPPTIPRAGKESSDRSSARLPLFRWHALCVSRTVDECGRHRSLHALLRATRIGGWWIVPLDTADPGQEASDRA
jgi:hypothetical protein